LNAIKYKVLFRGEKMDKKFLILSVLALLGVVGVIFLETSILSNAFLAGFGYVLSALCIVAAIIVGAVYK